MDITYLGHSSFKLNFKKASIVTDPFSNSIGIKFPKTSADIVTCSHQHDDHNAADQVKDYKKVLDGPGEYEINEVSIFGIHSYHDDSKGADRGKNTIFIFEADDLRICHLGDLGHKLKEKQFESIGDIDVLMIPVGGKYTIDADTAAEIAKSIEADIVIPMHYNTPDLDQKTFGELTGVDEFINDMATKVRNEDKLSVKKDDLTEEEQIIVVLKRK